jgi:hypothetical protein
MQTQNNCDACRLKQFQQAHAQGKSPGSEEQNRGFFKDYGMLLFQRFGTAKKAALWTQNASSFGTTDIYRVPGDG